MLTFAALDRSDTFTLTELATATATLPEDGLTHAAETLARALEGAGERRMDYWKNRVVPYLRYIWPKSRERLSPKVAGKLAKVCIAAQEAFPEALEVLLAALPGSAESDYLVHRLKEANLAAQYPEPALEFLNVVVHEDTRWYADDLRVCLEQVRSASPALAQDVRYQRLSTLVG